MSWIQGMTYVRHKGVPFLASDGLFQRPDERATFLVRYDAEQLIWVLVLVVDDELGSRAVLSEPGDTGIEFLATNDVRKVLGCRSMEFSIDASLEISRPAFVEPEVLPAGIGDEIPRPRMAQLMRDDMDVLSIARDHSRRHVGHGRILHTTKRERARENKDVVLTPDIRGGQSLGYLYELSGVFL